MRRACGVLVVVAGMLLTGCGGEPDGSSTSPPTAAETASDSGRPEGVGDRCSSVRTGSAGDQAWTVVVSGPGLQAGCEDAEVAALEMAECAESGADAPVEALLDCVGATGIGADGGVVTGWISGRPAITVREIQGPVSVDCSAGVGANPELAEPPAVDAPPGAEALKAAMMFGPVAVALQEVERSRAAWIFAMGTNDEAEAKARYDEARENLTKTIEAAEAGSDIPLGGTDLIMGLIGEIWKWLFGDDEPEQDDGNGQGGGAGGGEQPDPLAASECEDLAAFLKECSAADWQPVACQNFLAALGNPQCDPTVALTVEGSPCAREELNARDRQELMNRAIVRCWSVVNPGPDGDGVCAVRAVDGALSTVVAAPGELCAGGAVRPDDEDCLAEITDPQTVAQNLLGVRPDPLDVLSGVAVPPTPPGGGDPDD